MDPAALAGLCALLARGATAQPLPAGVSCPPPAAAAPRLTPSPRAPVPASSMATQLADPMAREAITRVAYAEAANQGDSGLAGVVYTILNRLQDGRWGGTVEAVVNARGQFEPVMRAGGSWRNLRPVSDAQRARIDTILNLALDGRLPDLTNGARFFQNASIVAAREAAGTVSPGLTNFGGAPASAMIGDHTFYAEAGRGGGGARSAPQAPAAAAPPMVIFVGANRAAERSALLPRTLDSSAVPAPLVAPEEAASPAPEMAVAVDPARVMFILPDGRGSDRGRR
ncbi:MAG: cell wall hydrolase [Phenylobacterium sp.]|uniref:cell wall hydrolase n=1 Tax=Phenylobacterium sp. TaxID=1871053 RepID=UPI0011FE351A|nr:cell wall hydrolase [Phenylobacterium sp.]TAL31273.1 MAG: cell wall hydrolase [Phenylobacterium sp.]